MGKGLKALGRITGTQNLTMYEQNECLKIIEKELQVLETLKAFGFEIEDYTENEHGSIKVKYPRIIVDDEEIDIAKEVLKNE